MSGTAKTTNKKGEPAVKPFILAATQNPPAKEPIPAKRVIVPPAEVQPVPDRGGVAVLALGEAGEILAARDACAEVFGWDPPELVGQNVRVLLKGGLDNDIGRFLHRHRSGENPQGTSELRVVALRKDGSEFESQVTTLTWNWDTAVTKKSDESRLCWTAAFLDLSKLPKAADPLPTEVASSEKITSGKSTLKMVEAAGSAPSVAPPPEASRGNSEAGDGQAADQVAVFELKQRIQELHEELSKTTSELTSAKAETEKLRTSEAEARAQLDAGKEAAGHAETALREETERREKLEERLQTLSSSLKQEQAERSKRFEEELLALRQERDDLDSKLSAEQRGTSDSTLRAQDLETELKRNASEFERVKAELEKQTVERQRSESTWREQLDTVWIAKKELEGACAGAVERSKRLEEELGKLRQEHDELNQKLEAEQQAAAESKQRAQELAGRLSRNAAESDRARTGLEKQNAERERADAEWRRQLDAANAIKSRLEASLAEAAEQNENFEKELGVLREERDELRRTKTEQSTVGAASQRSGELQRRIDQDAAEIRRLAAELEKEIAERARAETRAREQQEAAKALSRKLEADWASAVERNVSFEEELVNLRRSREELALQLKTNQHASVDTGRRAEELERRLERNSAELKRACAEAERLKADQERADSDWREQLDAAKALAKRLDAAWTGATERNRRFEGEAAELRQEREELLTKLAAAHREVAESRSRIDELERQSSQLAEFHQGHPDSNHDSDGKSSVLRQDPHQQNGHGTRQAEGTSGAALDPLPKAGNHSNHPAPAPVNSRTQPAQAPSRHPSQVQPYNFDLPTRPARREASTPKKRP